MNNKYLEKIADSWTPHLKSDIEKLRKMKSLGTVGKGLAAGAAIGTVAGVGLHIHNKNKNKKK